FAFLGNFVVIGIWSIGAKDKSLFCSRCSATSKQGPQVVKAVLEQSTTLSKWQDITNQDSEEREVLKVGFDYNFPFLSICVHSSSKAEFDV
ncbi:hypothetical protein IFM89_002659, partial [Coptis chinensis]